MGKKSRIKRNTLSEPAKEQKSEISPVVEQNFKKLLKIMSWIVGLCFLIVITLPNFEFYYLDFVIKFVFYLGVFNLLLFVFFEFFGEALKKMLSK